MKRSRSWPAVLLTLLLSLDGVWHVHSEEVVVRQQNQQLLRLYEELLLQKQSPDELDNNQPSLILVTAVYSNPPNDPGLAQDKLRPVLETAVEEVIACALYACSIRMNLLDFPKVESIPQVASLTPVRIRTRQSVVSQGVEGLRVDALRNSTFGASLTGQGITIGVISDSFDNTNVNLATNAADDVASGDLPLSVMVLDDSIPGSDEGRAMLQLIHDVVPDATLVFHTGAAGEAAFPSVADALVAAGCDIIVDDIGFPLEEPYFSDGISAQAVDAAVSADSVAFFSAAGNNGVRSYEAPFTPSGITIPSVGVCDFHAFSPSDIFQQITVENDDTDIVFQWDDAFFSAQGVSPSSDLDFFAFNSPATITDQPIRFSANIQLPGGNSPVEVLTLPAGTYDIGFCLFGGPAPGKVKWIAYGDVSNVEYDTQSSTLVGHPNAALGAAVASASCQPGTPCFLASPPIVNDDSSRGGTQIRIDTNGNDISQPQVRSQPRFTATDGTQTTFFQVQNGNDYFFFGKFVLFHQVASHSTPMNTGTSAAAPHAAAVAAIVLQNDPSLTPFEIYAMLESSATDMGSSGFDFESGFGLIDAFRAIGEQQPSSLPSLLPSVTPSSFPTSSPSEMSSPPTAMPSSSPTSSPSQLPSPHPTIEEGKDSNFFDSIIGFLLKFLGFFFWWL